MLRRSRARRSIVQLAGILLRVFDELGEGLDRDLGVHHQQVGELGEAGNRHEILFRVVRQVLVEERVNGVGAHRADKKGVSVRRGLGDGGRSDIAAGTGTVLDHEGLAVFGLKLLGDDAGEEIRRAAGAEGDDDRHLLLRPRRGLGLRCADAEETGQADGRKNCLHMKTSLNPFVVEFGAGTAAQVLYGNIQILTSRSA